MDKREAKHLANAIAELDKFLFYQKSSPDREAIFNARLEISRQFTNSGYEYSGRGNGIRKRSTMLKA